MGVPRTLAKGLSKLKEAAELRKLGGTQAERMARAAEQGYDTSKVWYHGTTQDIARFDPAKAKAEAGAFFFTDNTGLAARYAGSNPGANIVPVYLKRDMNLSGYPMPSDDAIKAMSDDEVGALIRDIDKWNESIIHKPTYVENEMSRSSGAGTIFRQLDDPNYYSPLANTVSDVAAVTDPSAIRSVNADFNPASRDSPNLLAGIAGAMPYAAGTAALLAGATGSQEAEAGPLQSLGRAAPYLTSAALGGAAALQSGDAEAGKLSAASDVIEALVRRAGDADIPEAAYRGGHTAPINPDYYAPLHDMTQTYPDDIYSAQGARYYGHGDPQLDRESFDVINRVRGDENAPVTMYRAVPGSAPNEINPGDWVTPNLEYARLHGERWDDYKILKGETNAGRLRTEGNSPHEFGYTGNATPALLGATAVGTGAGMYAASDAEAGPLDALGRAAPYLATGALGAAMMTPQDTQAYNDYIRDEMEARTAADRFTQMRGSKAGYWEARRQELLDMVSGLGALAGEVADVALRSPTNQAIYGIASMNSDKIWHDADMPLRSLLAGGGVIRDAAQGQNLQTIGQNAQQIVNNPSDKTTYRVGGAVTDALSPYTTPEAAAAAGALVHGGIQIASPF